MSDADPISDIRPGPILVVGGTGMLGRPVVERLLAEGRQIRLLSRDPARARALFGDRVDHRSGDVADPGALDRALAGAAAVHINLRATTVPEFETVEAAGTRAVAEAAARAGVRRITYLSGAGIEHADPKLPPMRAKQAAEAAIRASGVPYAILRATHFMESLDLFVRGGKAEIIGEQPHRYHYLAAADYARQAARALALPDDVSGAYALLGPEALTMREALERYRALIRPDLVIRGAPLPLLKLLARVTGKAELRHVTTLFDTFRQVPEGPRDLEAERLLGPAPTRLDDWARDHAAGPSSRAH